MVGLHCVKSSVPLFLGSDTVARNNQDYLLCDDVSDPLHCTMYIAVNTCNFAI